MEKTCVMCGITKLHKDFYKEKRVADGLTARCKQCTRQAATTSYQGRREQVLASHKEKYCAKIAREQSLMRNYGMTVDEWNVMFAEQNFRCAICGSKNPLTATDTFVVDHCHSGDHVRGILCGPCNSLLGLAHDDHNTLVDAAMYVIARSTGESISDRKKRHGRRESDTKRKRRARGED